MNKDQETILLIKGAISELPADQVAKCHECADQIRQAIAKAGDAGLMALALVGAEAQMATA
jgi:hypothetical protein